MIAAGIDVGSVATKAALILNDNFYSVMVPTGWSPREAGQTALNQVLEQSGASARELKYVVGTGYGRVSLPFVSQTVTEIRCHARGASWLRPGSEIVLDVGGQDCKAIRTDCHGKVLDFVMNDKCAAGTGRFLQVIAAALGSDVSELSEQARGHKAISLNSMCAVFAETEVIGLLAAGVPPGEIVAGLHQSIARRLASMIQRLGPVEQLVFTGGVARNENLRETLENMLGMPVLAPSEGQMAGALGAALIARDMIVN